jgi:membrane protein required for colicin V production
MGWLDWLFLILMAAALIRGAVAGLINELVGLVGFIFALMLASVLYVPVGRLFEGLGGSFDISGPLAFLVVFIAAMVLLLFLGKVISKLIDATIAGWVNHLVGAVVGFLKGFLVCAAIVLVIHRLPSGPETRRQIEQGPLTRPAALVAEPLAGLVESLALSATEDDSWWRPGLEEALGVEDGEWEVLEELTE